MHIEPTYVEISIKVQQLLDNIRSALGGSTEFLRQLPLTQPYFFPRSISWPPANFSLSFCFYLRVTRFTSISAYQNKLFRNQRSVILQNPTKFFRSFLVPIIKKIIQQIQSTKLQCCQATAPPPFGSTSATTSGGYVAGDHGVHLLEALGS